MITKFTAVKALVGGGLTGGDNLDEYVYHNNQVPPSEAEVNAKLKELQADYDSKQYQRDRQYPEISEQLDLIYWDKKNGTKKWEETIDKIKKDFPKPE
jgi:hypothetical protein